MVSKLAYHQRLQRLLFLLRHRQAGTVTEIARQLNCTDRTVNYCLSKLRKDGFVIEFDRNLKKHVLLEDE